jgi:hypothetical protein
LALTGDKSIAFEIKTSRKLAGFLCERKTGFEPAAFSLASRTWRNIKENVVRSNLDLLPTTNSMKKNVRENAVFCEVAKCDLVTSVDSLEPSKLHYRPKRLKVNNFYSVTFERIDRV